MNIPEYQVTENSLSLFKGKLTLKTVIEQNIKIAKAFPELNDSWFELFNERIKENGFTDERLIEAVKFVIDTFHYKNPNIANFISYDKRIELLTERELTLKADKEGISIRKLYELVDIDGKPYYTLKSNIGKYGLKKYQFKEPESKVKQYYQADRNKPIKSIKQAFEESELRKLSNNVAIANQ